MSEIVNLNVGGKQFSTSRHTLLWSGNSFFSALLAGRLPSSKDETGAFFIDRDPELFSVILNYLRSGEFCPRGIDLGTLKNEAQFYGLDSLVKKLSLCGENFHGGCGDLLFHAYMPPPELPHYCKIGTSVSHKEVIANSDTVVPSCSTAPSSSTGPSTSLPVVETNTVFLGKGHSSQSAGEASEKFTKINEDIHEKSESETIQENVTSHPVTLITCYQNVMAVAYTFHVGLFHLKDPTGWRLVWMSPRLSAPVDRVAVTTKNTNTFALGAVLNSVSGNSNLSPSVGAQQFAGIQQNSGASSGFSTTAYNSASGAGVQQVTLPSQPSQPLASMCLVACAIGSKIIVWCLYPPTSSSTSAVALCGATLGVATTPASSGLSPLFSPSGRLKQPSLTQLKEPWAHDLVGRYDLNGRAVDYLLFIDAHLVALSRRGLVGVRHVMSNMWQVWSTVPILSYSVAASELLLLGCANGRICSINIQKFPLRIVDNDLLVTEMYRDPLQDPITALSMHFAKSTSGHLGCIEIAYGTLSGRVGLIVQYPENVGYSPQLLQTFAVHRSMVTRVVLSEKHLISVCSESNHVRTWAITRFRGIISTHPGCIPTASFHVTTLDTSSAQSVADSVSELVRCCLTKTGTQIPSRDVVRARSNLVSSHVSHNLPQSSSSQRQQHEHAQPQLPQSSSSQQARTQRHSQPFRFSNWRRHGSHSRSPVIAVSDSREYSSYGPAPLQRSELTSSFPAHPVESISFNTQTSGGEPLLASYRTLTAASGCNADVFIMPRTSWLHEDPGNIGARASLVSGSRSTDTEDHDNPSGHGFVVSTPGVPVGRCQTFHGASPDSRIPIAGGRQLFAGTTRKVNPKSSIEIHRFANDPGPYGEREDVLVFIQKVTPSANQLFVRLASTGKRVCVIHSVDNTPISSFCVHEHDGSNRIGAHPRRYIFTGHADGSIQVWDLTTALTMLRASGGLDSFNPPGAAPTADYSVSTGVLNVPSVATPALIGPIMMPNVVQTSSLSLSCVSAGINDGGPNSLELLRLLESCQLGGSSIPPSGITPSDSMNSVLLSTPSTTHSS